MQLPSCPLRFAARHYADQIAIIGRNENWSFKKFDQQVERRATTFKKIGIRPGMIVSLIATISISSLVDLLAIWRIGAIAAPLSPRLPALSREQVLARLRPAIFLDHLSFAPPQYHHLQEVEDPNRLATMLLTSGTTSQPKIAVHSLSNHLFSALGASDHLCLNEGDRWLLSLPLYHVGGIGVLVRCLLKGASLIIDTNWSFSSPTHLSFVPTQLYRLLQERHPSNSFAHIKCLLLGGAPIPSELYRQALASGLPLFTSWGMTETSALVTSAKPLSGSQVEPSVGKPLPFRQLRIAQDGEILVAGPTLFRGYWEEDQLHLPVDQEGWFATRDLGEIDEQDTLHWLGRKDHLFISGGENIQPEEIESILCQQPNVLEAVVVPISDREFGQRPVAFILYQNASRALDPQILQKNLEKQLPRFKIPCHIFPLPPPISGDKRNRAHLQQLASTYLEGL